MRGFYCRDGSQSTREGDAGEGGGGCSIEKMALSRREGERGEGGGLF